mmetsp:Transcript_55537/g.116227  ORF Transcript_55537/g.116227 Transcript_55537/m.116227 type:complete len:85 (+) Transcript_55537:27-281(+)
MMEALTFCDRRCGHASAKILWRQDEQDSIKIDSSSFGQTLADQQYIWQNAMCNFRSLLLCACVQSSSCLVGGNIKMLSVVRTAG